MNKKKKRWKPINPSFIKNKDGQITGVFLTTKEYQSVLKTVAEWQKIKKELKQKKGKSNS